MTVAAADTCGQTDHLHKSRKNPGKIILTTHEAAQAAEERRPRAASAASISRMRYATPGSRHTSRRAKRNGGKHGCERSTRLRALVCRRQAQRAAESGATWGVDMVVSSAKREKQPVND